MSLTYSKNAVIKGFSGSDAIIRTGQFANDVEMTPAQRVNEIYTKSNDCRGWFEPSFADETKYFPVSQPTMGVTKVDAVVINASATVPPKKVQEDTLTNALLVGVGVFVIYKLLS